ncbi:DUF6541 family protein [Arthrobacter sp. H35-D1]|uniref:DUF6541 family protein n=1 Tax=Arthrobacter sp. H35-D1 TaxID=3046202 RepID=UPI0024BA7920|nr:DUF6541 family protein [Arthrobacter sp. H35-D1]MDJ0312966.1 hypothetical protein [Arthrobacter sp. H35-D1]
MLVCIALVLIPGGALAYALGFRRVSVLGLAPVLSLSLVGVAAVGASFVGVGWNIWAVVVLAVVACLVAWLITDFRQKSTNRAGFHRDSWLTLGAMVVGVAAGALLIARRFMQLVGAPDNISQRYDNVFQLNAVRHILDTGDGSTLTLGQMAGGHGLGAVYPAVWHDLAALLVQLTGTPIAVAENAVNMCVAALIWPISIIFLTRVVAGPKPVALMAAGVASAGLVAFPFLLLVWGPLFPNLLSISVVPAALAIVILLCKLSDQRERPLRLWATTVIMIPGLAFSHMSALGALLAFGAPMILWAVGLHVKALAKDKAPIRKYAVVAAASVAGLALGLLLWLRLRPDDYSGWTPHTNVPGAIGEVVANGVMGTEATWVISILAVIGGAVILGKRTHIWWLLSYAVAASLYIADASLDRGFIRTFLTGVWYADTNRVAAYLPIFAVVLAAIGFKRVVEVVLSAVSRLQRNTSWWTKSIALAVVLALFGLLALGTQVGTIRNYIGAQKVFYERDTGSSILSDDEYKLLARIDSEVPANAVIAGNPWNGSGLVYAFADRKVLRYHLSQHGTPAEVLVEEKLNTANSDPAVCNAVRELNVKYVLDFGEQYLLNHPDSKDFGGLQNLAGSGTVELVDQEGAAKLYRVTACW